MFGAPAMTHRRRREERLRVTFGACEAASTDIPRMGLMRRVRGADLFVLAKDCVNCCARGLAAPGPYLVEAVF